MKAYRLSVNLKLGLIIFALLIAVASVWYTNRLAHRLGEREETIIQLWAEAQAQLPEAARQQSSNPHLAELRALERFLTRLQTAPDAGSRPSPEQLEAYRQAVTWAQGMPPSSELDFITNEIIVPNAFDIPAIVTNARSSQPQFWRNVPVDSSLAALSPEDSAALMQHLRELQADMDEAHSPIPIELRFAGAPELEQLVHYGESQLVRELRFFPYVQLLFLGLFVLVGYLGFSYVRRSEQSSLWVGMAKEAAHQLGTPISSLMGWTELLRIPDLPREQKQEAVDEMEKDIDRLRRVANRFSDIGSMPKLDEQPLAPLLQAATEYMRRRIPRQANQVALDLDVTDAPRAPVNAELFEWVMENLLKNALDAIESSRGEIAVAARRVNGRIHIEVSDTGKGIDRRQWKNIFRPGYSTKKRGWGLGLSLAKRIVEDYHGGALKVVTSKVGRGTTFRIDLPAANREQAKA